MSAKTYTKQLLKQNQGVAMIEFAIILPVLMLITFGAIEYGMYFLKSNMNNNNVAAAARAVQNNPGSTSSRDLLSQTSLINNENNKACAKSFSTLEAAKAAQCPPGLWDTMPPEDLPEGQTAYFVLIESNVVSKSLSGLFDEGSALDVIMPTNIARQVIEVDSSASCSAEALGGRRCYAAIEKFNAQGFIEKFNQYDHYTERTSVLGLVNVHINSGRSLHSEAAQCLSGTWSCENFESHLVESYGQTSQPRRIITPGVNECLQGVESNGHFRCDRFVKPKYKGVQATGVKEVLLTKPTDIPNDFKDCYDEFRPSHTLADVLRPQPEYSKEFSTSGKVSGSGKGYGCWSGPR